MIESLYQNLMEKYHEWTLERKLKDLNLCNPECFLCHEEVKFIRHCYHVKSDGYPETAKNYIDKYMEWRKQHLLKVMEMLERER